MMLRQMSHSTTLIQSYEYLLTTILQIFFLLKANLYRQYILIMLSTSPVAPSEQLLKQSAIDSHWVKEKPQIF